MTHDRHKRRPPTQDDGNSVIFPDAAAFAGDPLAFDLPTYTPGTEPLTAEIARGWLETGVPSCREIVMRHGMRKWNLCGDAIGAWEARRAFIREVGYGVPCQEAIAACVAAAPLVEIGAGTGFWSALITDAGGDVIAVDSQTVGYDFRKATFGPVLVMDAAEAVSRFPERNVLMVWPCYSRNWAAQVAKAMRPGRTLLLVHEGGGGCIGDDDLFETLEASFDEIEHISLPVWPGIGDHMTVFRRK